MTMLAKISLAAAVLASATLAAPIANQTYTLDNIPASKDLVWYPCRGTFECARLAVPLNPKEPKNGLFNEIPLIKAPADKSTEYKGFVLYNPGGPGGVGTDYYADVAGLAPVMFGPGYDVICFDTRGTGHSKPLGDIIPLGDLADSNLNATSMLSPRSLASPENASNKFGFRIPALDSKFWQRVAQDLQHYNSADGIASVNGVNQALRYMSTPHVAHDMLSIAKADARLRGLPENNVLVNYYGVSYGTALGQAFATMFPDHVGRFLLDGNVNGKDYFAGTQWAHPETSIEHTDENFLSFFEQCSEAGSKFCAFHTGSTAKDIIERFNILIGHFDAAKAEREGWSNVTDLSNHLASFLGRTSDPTYNPSLYSSFAKFLLELENLVASGNATAEDIQKVLEPEYPTNILPESFDFIRCSDSNNAFVGSGKVPTQDMIDLWRSKSVILDTAPGGWYTRCAQLKGLTPNLRLDPDQIVRKKTKTPILFTGATLDPVTPVENADKMSKFFVGSEVLRIEGAAHGISGISDLSCGFAKTSAYFQNGTMPGADNFCKKAYKNFFIPTTGTNVKVKRALKSKHSMFSKSKYGYITDIVRPDPKYSIPL